MSESTELARRKTIEELVREWNLAIHEVKRGIEILRDAEERLLCFSASGTRYDLQLFTQHECSLEFERKEKRLKAAAWRYLVQRAEIKKVMSIRRCEELDKQLQEPDTLPEITLDNILGWLESLNERATGFLEEAAVEVFQWLRPSRQHYKTNDPFKVGKRVILPYMVARCYSGRGFRVDYYREDKLRALDNVFHLLDGRGLSKTADGNLIDAIRSATEGQGETEFFRFRCFRNQNLHLEFKRPDLVKKLNEIGGNGLPMPDERRCA
jgi:hypothetical protein